MDGQATPSVLDPRAIGGTDPAPSQPSRPNPPDARDPAGTPPLTLLATDGVAYLVHWLVILILLGQAMTSVARPPAGVLAVGLAAGLVCLLWSTFALAMGILRGTRPDGGDVPPPGWLPALASASCLTSLVMLRVQVGGTEPWPSELGAAALVVASVTVWRGEWFGGVVGVLLGTAALIAPVVGGGPTDLVASPLQQSAAGITLIAASFAVALALRWVRRSAQGLQETIEARDELLVRERAVRDADRLASELERSLHDTALNTLETIAAHGEHLAPDVVAARCQSDVDQLARWRSETGLRRFAEVLERLVRHADRLGLVLEVDQVGPPPDSPQSVAVPPPVLHALAGAASEALTNVAKHARVDRATLLVLSSGTSLQVLIGDDGVGLGEGRSGFGVVSSVSERMRAAGGTALVGPGPGGRGTVVALAWQPEPEPVADVAGDLLARVAGVVVGVTTFLAGVATALDLLAWSGFLRPWAALAAAIAPVLVSAGLLNRARAGERLGAGHVAAAAAAYLGVGVLAIAADPTCSTPFQQGVLMDLRAPIVIVPLLLAPRFGVLVALLGTVATAHVGAAIVWLPEPGPCGVQTASTGLYLVAGLVALWLFARWITRASAAFARTRADAVDAESRILSRISVRAEEELWVADTLASAQSVLGRIAEGQCDPADPRVRAECANEASFLRGLLAVGRAPQRLRRPARIWMRLLHQAGCQVQVRGRWADCHPPAQVVGEAGGVLDTVCALAPGSLVTIAAWSDTGAESLTVTSTGEPVRRAGDALVTRVDRIAVSAAWREVHAGTLTAEWAFSAPARANP